MQPDRASKSLIVEGWRFLPHSYAIVNQWQLLALLRRNIRPKVVDVPFYRPYWQAQAGLLEAPLEDALRSLQIAAPGESADVTLRYYAPFSFAPSCSHLTAVFATLEQQALRKHQFAHLDEWQALRRGRPPASVKVITPSHWSAQGFYKAGFGRDQVAVVPHGVDTLTFRPAPDRRTQARSRLGLGDGHFVFLSVGAMAGNKGIDVLLRAFTEVSRRNPSAKLMLKGVDPLYKSGALLAKQMGGLSARDRDMISDSIVYVGESLSSAAMASLYQLADVYVSPYRAEGFNLPVLEAAACGLPVICTRGGPTEDFVTDEFAHRIASRTVTVDLEGQDVSWLEPDVDDLIALMAGAIADETWRGRAAKAGPEHVARRYTWDLVADTLIREFL